eukprot:scaffold52481_cov61-Attheya_sp.AAC.1
MYYRTLRTYLKPSSQAVTYVEVPKDPEEDPNTSVKWIQIFNKHKLEQALQERNRKHFAQAATDRTPFTIDPLYSLLKFKSDTEFGRHFREGVIDLKTKVDIDNDDDPHKIDEDLDLQEVMSGLKKWNEQTTTGGRHLGHYKSWLMKRKDDEESLTAEEFFKTHITIYRTCCQESIPTVKMANMPQSIHTQGSGKLQIAPTTGYPHCRHLPQLSPKVLHSTAAPAKTRGRTPQAGN